MKNLAILINLFLIFQSGQAEKWVVDTTRSNSVIFYANSTFGSFEGKTDDIRGSIAWDGKDTLATGKVHFGVDLRTIDTGIGLRNTHMRNKYLETEMYPMAVFEGDLTGWEVKGDIQYELTATGIMQIHGVEKEIRLTSTVQKITGIYRSITSFELNISEYNIKQPGFLLTSMDKVVRLRIIVFLTAESPGR